MKITLFSLLSACLLLVSCTSHVGTVSAGSAVITNSEFSKIRFAYGTSKTTHVLGIGGNQKDALILEAKRNLYLNCNLKPNEAIGQTVVDIKKHFFFPVLSTRIIISAEIIDFSKDNKNLEESSMELQRFINKKSDLSFDYGSKANYYYRGDSIEVQILDFQSELYVVKFFDKRNKLKVKTVSPSQLRNINGGKEPKVKLLTPKNSNNELIAFTYQGVNYVGELLRTVGDNFIIRMERADGTHVRIIVPRKDILK